MTEAELDQCCQPVFDHLARQFVGPKVGTVLKSASLLEERFLGRDGDASASTAAHALGPQSTGCALLDGKAKAAQGSLLALLRRPGVAGDTLLSVRAEGQ